MLNKLIKIIASTIVFTILWFIMTAIFFFLQQTITGRPTGAIVAIGGLFGIWVAYKLTSKIVNEVFNLD